MSKLNAQIICKMFMEYKIAQKMHLSCNTNGGLIYFEMHKIKLA